jgi:hypothetical protein
MIQATGIDGFPFLDQGRGPVFQGMQEWGKREILGAIILTLSGKLQTLSNLLMN